MLSTAGIPSASSIKEEWFGRPHPAGLYRSACTIPANFLNDKQYFVTVYLIILGPLSVEADAQQVVSFQVRDDGNMREAGSGRDWHGVVRVRLPWRTEFVEPIRPVGSGQEV